MSAMKNRQCFHEDCAKQPSFGLPGTRNAEACRSHAGPGMVDVLNARCAHDGCISQPSYERLKDGTPSVCRRHGGDLGGVSALLNYRGKCAERRCRRVRKWGHIGATRTHCEEHGKADGLQMLL